MRLFRNLLIVLLVVAAFLLGLMFMSANASTVSLDLLVPGWQWQVPLGGLVLILLVAGLVIGLLAGIGLKGLLGLVRGGKS